MEKVHDICCGLPENRAESDLREFGATTKELRKLVLVRLAVRGSSPFSNA